MNEIEVPLEMGSKCLKLKLLKVTPGRFIMGDNETVKEGTMNEPEGQFEVVISQPFWLGVYPITQCQWQSLMNSNPSNNLGVNLPVETISWHDAMNYCERLNNITTLAPEGYEFNLPTEAQWEYACRAGNDYKYQLGDTIDALLRVAWYNDNTKQHRTEEVGKKESNSWGFFDMLGNIFEWCFDSYTDYPTGTTQIDWIGDTDEAFRNIRGGAALTQPIASDLTCSGRGYRHGNFGNSYTGFRLCLCQTNERNHTK